MCKNYALISSRLIHYNIYFLDYKMSKTFYSYKQIILILDLCTLQGQHQKGKSLKKQLHFREDIL